MEPAEGIVVRTFGLMTDADLAASQLRAAGIECTITTDDCAGMYPSMGVIRLTVEPARAEEARRLLHEPVAVQSSPRVPEPEEAGTNGGLPRVYRFNSGLFAGAIIGALLHFSYTKWEQYHDGNDWYDKDDDGMFEEERIWRGGENVEARLDRNGDTRLDDWAYYRKNQILRQELDDNFDGRVDTWVRYSPKGMANGGEFDTDHNGVRDAFSTYTNGVLMQIDWRPNGTNVVLLRQLFRHGIVHEELRDHNGDGLFDLSIKYDAFLTPISTNSLRATTVPTP
jgi:hypothetical protein